MSERLHRNAPWFAGAAALAAATGFAACVCGGPGSGTGTATVTSITGTAGPTAVLGSTSPLADTGPTSDGGTVIVHLEAEPVHLNYLIQQDAWMNRMTVHHVYQTLILENPYTYEFEGELADRWEISDDKLVYTFHLRTDVKWHDGQPFTSADVVYTFDKILKDETAKTENVRETLKPYCDTFEAPDPSTFVLRCKKAYAFLPTTLADGVIIVPKHVFEKGDFDDHHPANRAPVGTGPFKFDHWEAGKEIVFVKNPDYWGAHCTPTRPPGVTHCKAHLDKLVFKYVADRYTAFNLVKTGEIDVMDRLLPEMVTKEVTPELLASYNQVSYYPSSFGFTLFNLDRPFFGDRRVREAFAHLWNNEGIIKDLYFGLAKPIFGPYWLESPSLHPTLKPYTFDPARAAALFAEAGWADGDKDGVLDKDGVKMSFDFLFTANSKTLAKVLTYVKNDFTKAGAELNITPIEWALFTQRLKEHKFDLTALLFILPSPRTDFANLFHSRFTEGGQNYSNFRNPKADELLDKIAVTFDDAERRRLEHELQELLYNELPMIFTQCIRIDSMVHKRFRNVRPSLKWFTLEDWWSPPGEKRI